MTIHAQYVLTVTCPDTTGIVAAVSGFLSREQGNILDSAQFGDLQTGLFFMRVEFQMPAGTSLDQVKHSFETIATQFNMNWQIHDTARKPRLLIMVSKFGHCLNDLLYRYRIGSLKADIPAIVSNHRDYYQLAAWHDVPFHHLPVTRDNKQKQEQHLLEIIDQEQIDLVILARYMQVLSPALSERLAGRVINIHHSFLPSFKGAKPYEQAYGKGVKLIGATAHYVTADLDEGPIIEQEVARVDHRMTPEDLSAIGQDIESRVLARAVKLHLEHRVALNGHKTVVFD